MLKLNTKNINAASEEINTTEMTFKKRELLQFTEINIT